MSQKIYTGAGDHGETYLANGTKVSKTDLLIRTGAALDTLNAHVGILCSLFEEEHFTGFSFTLQNQFFQIGLYPLPSTVIPQLEAQIDLLTSQLPPLTHFILPRGNTAVAQAHLCRCSCREAEILIVEAYQQGKLSDPQLLPYFNRLGDYFFVVARYIAFKTQTPEIPWSAFSIEQN